MKKLLVYLRPYRLQAILAPVFKLLEAAALAFIVLYNLTNINITEHDRKASTIEGLDLSESAATL